MLFFSSINGGGGGEGGGLKKRVLFPDDTLRLMEMLGQLWRLNSAPKQKNAKKVVGGLRLTWTTLKKRTI
jgi:hypothetical protein